MMRNIFSSHPRFLFFILFLAGLQGMAAQTLWDNTDYQGEPWVRNISHPYSITHGLDGRHLSIWASHGRYFKVDQQRWSWQRLALYGTNEDLFTQTIVVPYLIPMLENAGAVVFTPRERDWQRHEVIVDNDDLATSMVKYQEKEYRHAWKTTDINGFAQHEGNYKDGENPFEQGTARMAKTTHNKNKTSLISYQPTIPEEGQYAVYVSYQTLSNSIPDAHYTVWHKGEKTEFLVNQQMGGGTWVYLGTFDFDKGSNIFNRVTLSNYSGSDGVVTADAVRFGGGMGNIQRGETTSGLPRCLEGARYYAQWAGMPYHVYSTREGTNDYADDINVRSLMTNELLGGSVYAPDSVGRKVPIELSLAIHSDAGYNKPAGSGIFGSLTICTTKRGDSLLAAGHSRQMSFDLAAELLDNTAIDLQKKYGKWVSRELYDRNYSETRVPIVPSAILETMSHQNFGDMRFGQDPNFRFTLARSIYKTLLRYIAKKHGCDYTVTPLAPQAFRIEFTQKEGEIRLTWSPTIDEQEPSSTPSSYIVYTAEGKGAFDNGTVISSTAATMKLKPGTLYSFRVAALNNGGSSFPSETLSAYYQPKARKTALIINGFQRLSSPAFRDDGIEQGFDLDDDIGVSYGRTCGWLGRQHVYDVSRIGIEDTTGLGYTSEELAGQFIGGNDFNYVRTHAEDISETEQYNIVSCSKTALHRMSLYEYNLVDVILGLERNDGHSLVSYKAFTPELQKSLAQFTAQGGRLLVSGAYVASDMNNDDNERRFVSHVLKCRYEGESRLLSDTIKGLGMYFPYYHRLNEYHYAATRTDRIMPADPAAFPAMLYADGSCAATAYRGNDYSAFIMGFPIECIQRAEQRKAIMRGILKFLLP